MPSDAAAVNVQFQAPVGVASKSAGLKVGSNVAICCTTLALRLTCGVRFVHVIDHGLGVLVLHVVL